VTYIACTAIHSAAHVQDPVRSQEFMLSDAHRELLFRLTGVQGWHFEQCDGEGVFIPSGCAHQARAHVCLRGASCPFPLPVVPAQLCGLAPAIATQRSACLPFCRTGHTPAPRF
jgi:JmjC domain, hydroxylase